MSETLGSRARFVCEAVVKSARLMVGVPDYQTYVDHRRTVHPDLPVMTYRSSSATASRRATPSAGGGSAAAAESALPVIASEPPDQVRWQAI